MTPSIDDIDTERVQEIGETIRGLEVHDRVKLTNNRWESYAMCEVLEKVNRVGGDEFYRALLEDLNGRRIEVHANWRDIPPDADDQETPYTGAIVAPFDDTAPPVTYIEVVSGHE